MDGFISSWRHCELWDTNRDWVIALWAPTGLDGMDLLTTAKERMFLEKENDFQYVLSKPCFSHNLLSSLENRKTSWHMQTSIFQVALSQLGGEHNFVWDIFCCQDFMEGYGNTCAAEAAMTLEFIFHLPCFLVALLQNWCCTDIFIDGMHFFSSLNTKNVRSVFHVCASEVKFPSFIHPSYCVLAKLLLSSSDNKLIVVLCIQRNILHRTSFFRILLQHFHWSKSWCTTVALNCSKVGTRKLLYHYFCTAVYCIHGARVKGCSDFRNFS